MMDWATGPLTAAMFTLISAACLICMEMIAAELENPFGEDTNDLPCDRFQDDFNEGLLLLIDPATYQEFHIRENFASYAEMIGSRPSRKQSFTHSFKEALQLHQIEAMVLDSDDSDGDNEVICDSLILPDDPQPEVPPPHSPQSRSQSREKAVVFTMSEEDSTVLSETSPVPLPTSVSGRGCIINTPNELMTMLAKISQSLLVTNKLLSSINRSISDS